MERQVNAFELARGSWQRQILREMLAGKTRYPVSCLKGRAASYAGHYKRSFWNLVQRLDDAGFGIEMRRGPRGGMTNATFRVWYQ